MRNSQVAVLSAVIIAGALIVAASNWMLVKSLRDPREGAVATFTMDSGGTAKLLFVMGALCLAGGVAWAWFAYSHDMYGLPPRIACTVGALIACWLLWLAFPLMEQVGIDRESMGV